MTVHETGDAQPMQITRSFRHRITNSGRRSNYREGENISLHFAKKKKKIRRRESSVNPQTPRPDRQISAGDFFLLEKKERAPVPLEMRRSR